MADSGCIGLFIEGGGALKRPPSSATGAPPCWCTISASRAGASSSRTGSSDVGVSGIYSFVIHLIRAAFLPVRLPQVLGPPRPRHESVPYRRHCRSSLGRIRGARGRVAQTVTHPSLDCGGPRRRSSSRSANVQRCSCSPRSRTAAWPMRFSSAVTACRRANPVFKHASVHHSRGLRAGPPGRSHSLRRSAVPDQARVHARDCVAVSMTRVGCSRWREGGAGWPSDGANALLTVRSTVGSAVRPA